MVMVVRGRDDSISMGPQESPQEGKVRQVGQERWGNGWEVMAYKEGSAVQQLKWAQPRGSVRGCPKPGEGQGQECGPRKTGFQGQFGELCLEEPVGFFYLTRRLRVVGDVEFPGDVETLCHLLGYTGDESRSVV